MKKPHGGLLFLVLTLLLSCCSLSFAATEPPVSVSLSDIAGLDCEEAVTSLVDLGLINGFADGTFRPDQLLTRAEAAAMLAKAFRLKANSAQPGTATDIQGHWAENVINLCLANGLFDLGNTNGEFQPSVPLTYDGFCFTLFCGLLTEGSASYDVDAEPALAAKFGITEGVTSIGDFVLRGEAAQLIYNALRLPLIEATDEAATFKQKTDGATYLDMLRADKALANGTVQRNFTLVGYYEDDLLNAISLVPNPTAYVWNAHYDGFIKTEAKVENLKYNFVAVVNTTGEEASDTLFIVNRADSKTFWDAEAIYVDPRAAKDAMFAGTYAQEYSIPYGERLLAFVDANGEYQDDSGAMNYNNIVATGDLSASTYYPVYDWYNSTGTDTLTLLSGFKTSQQTNSWACGATSALMVMDWFDLRGDLNELDLGALRNTKEKYGAYRWGSSTDVKMLINIFTALNEMEGKETWQWLSTYDFVDDEGILSDEYLSPEWIKEMLAQGRPVLVGWNAYGAHWQVIIGYDDMGTEDTADDVLILADPYDTTSHRNNGVIVQSYQRLLQNWTQNFDRDFSKNKGYGMPVIFAPYPVNQAEYTPASGIGLVSKKGEFNNPDSPYYPAYDFSGGSDLRENLSILKGFETAQQTTPWTSGATAAGMVLNWFDLLGEETELSLAELSGEEGESITTLDGMVQIFTALNEKAGEEVWGWLTSDDLDEEWCVAGHSLYGGSQDDGIIPFCLENGIPVIVGWNEWGGHWQVAVGYDDMTTYEWIIAVQDDVLILADPNDTTDHNPDGFVVQPFARLVFGWGAAFDPRGYETFIIAAPMEKLIEAGLISK